MDIAMERRGPPIGDDQLERFERGLDGGLPAGYRRFLLGLNGGVPRRAGFFVDGQSFLFDSFFSLGSALALEDLEVRRMALLTQVPAELLAIGRDLAGNFLCLRIAEPMHGHVYLFAIDRSARGHKPAPIWLASTFDEFVDSMHLVAGPKCTKK